MKKIAFVVYRQWAYDIFQQVKLGLDQTKEVSCPLLVTTQEHEFELPNSSNDLEVVICSGNDQTTMSELFVKHQIDTVCFYGWSWIVKEPMLSDYTCLCLHPSPLPRYRGGSPIQAQLIAGETESAVSLIKMSKGIDDGDIFDQVPISLDGYLEDILPRIVEAGMLLTDKYKKVLIKNEVLFKPQKDLASYPPLRRRTPADGEIDTVSVASLPYISVYNLVRGLQAPYPPAFIKALSGIIYVKKVEFKRSLPLGVNLLAYLREEDLTAGRVFALKSSDGYVVITEYSFLLNDPIS